MSETLRSVKSVIGFNKKVKPRLILLYILNQAGCFCEQNSIWFPESEELDNSDKIRILWEDDSKKTVKTSLNVILKSKQFE